MPSASAGVESLTPRAWTIPVVTVALATAASIVTGSIAFSPVRYCGTRDGDVVRFPTITGMVTVSSGPLPSTVILSFSEPSPGRVDLRRDAGLTVPVDPSTGAFAVDGVYNAIVDGENPFGFIYAGVLYPGDVTYGLATGELDG